MAGLGFETCVPPRIFALSHYIGAYLDHSPNKNCRHRWVWYVFTDNNGNKIRERVRKCFAIRLSFREHGNLLQPQSMKLPTTPVAVKSFPSVKLGENNHKPIFCFHWIKCANEKKSQVHSLSLNTKGKGIKATCHNAAKDANAGYFYTETKKN